MTAMTISDNERREVARRLRETKAECEERGYPWMCDDLILALGYDHDYEAGDEIFDRLADLIEPGDSAQTVAGDMFGQMRHSTEQERIAYADMMARKSVELHTVDRDALLALEDEMFEGATGLAFISQLEKNEELQDLQSTMAKALMDYARRIRDALGGVP